MSKIVEAVCFDGSSTMSAAIEKWLETGVYRHPPVQARDYKSFAAVVNGVNQLIFPGDNIYRYDNGMFRVLTRSEAERQIADLT